MKQYRVTLTGLTPLLMHSDNLAFGEKIQQWQKDPANKELSKSGDDRSPAWVWLGYLYHDGDVIGVPADNLMTMFREAGSKVINKGKETYKKQTQSGIVIDTQQWVINDGIPIEPLSKLAGNNAFIDHIEAAESAGFELLVKRAKIGQAKHVRVRPLFRDWTLTGSFTVIDEDQSGLVRPTLEQILRQAGSQVGLCDWRPSSPRSSGTFGKFDYKLTEI